ncbi:MAG: S8 family serine peptidase, partial [Acetomicrobium flavidum]|uniref:S8 family serine peptidase n=1 Tax=Acetomicrobium flavidum TaxID=49896 RepID=UPI0016A65FE3|nr:S8 family serine peptidase [Acetomicrobium flavidum]
KNAYEAGITFAISAGNNAFFDYAATLLNDEGKYTSYIKDPARVGAPGASRYAITVAAVNNQGTVLEGQKLKFNNDYVMYLTSPDSPDPVSVFGDEPVTIVDTNSQFCSVPEGNDMGYSGNVLLIDRGTCTFGEKVNNALAAGAIGVVVGNNHTDASLISMALGTAANTIPAVFIGGPDKLKLRSAIQAAGGSLQVVFSNEIARSYAATNPNAMASFTSWGPAPNMAFKPTVSAPGVSIFSSVPGNQYATYQGTSMAAPHVAGAVAVIKQAHPDWTPEQIKQALVNTAEPISNYSPRVQGAGRINVAKAVSNNVFITYNGQPYAELGAFTGNKTITLTITNKGTTTYTANISGYVTTSLGQYYYGNQGRTYTVGTVSASSSVSVEPGASKTVQVTIQPSEAWTNIFVEGRLLFASADGARVFPFLGYFGDWAIYSERDTINGDSKWPDNNNIIDLPWWNADSWDGLTGVYYPYGGGLYYIGRKAGQFEPKALAISAGSDYSEWNERLVVGLGMLRNARALTINVLNSAGKVVKTIVSENFVRAGVSSRDSTSAALRTGWSKLWEWDGTDRNGNFVPEGQYTIRIVAMPAPLISDESKLLPTQVMDIPVKVDKTPPISRLSDWQNATATLIDFRDEKVRAIIPTSTTFSLVATGTDNSSILSYYLFNADEAAGIDPANTATFTYNILEMVIDTTGTTNWGDGGAVSGYLEAQDGAGNVGVGEPVYLIYDNPDTPVQLDNLQAVADGEYLKVSFNVIDAPGAYYEVAVKDSNGALIETATGNAIGTAFPLRIIPIELSFDVPSSTQTYTVEVTAKDIYDHTTVISSGSFVGLNISLSPEGDGNFIVLKQGVSTPLTVEITGPVETTTITLSKSVVVDGNLTTTIVKQKSFSEATFSDPEFFDASLEAGRYQLTVEAKSALGQVAVVTRRVIVDGDIPKLDDIDVMSDDGEIIVEKQMTDHSIDLTVRTEDNTTGQIVLKASDESSAFVVYFDEDEIGWWGDTGAGGEGIFFVPVTLEIGSEESHVLKLIDEAGNRIDYTINVHVTSVEEPVGAAFELELEAGMNYFGIPVYVDKTLGEILPGVNVYRRSGTTWTLANDEKPMAFAVYRASLTEAKTVALEGEAFESSSITLKRNVGNYLSIPQISPVNAEALFGDALVSLSVITTNGAMVKVTDGIMLPGNAYVIIVNKDTTINLPLVTEDSPPRIRNVALELADTVLQPENGRTYDVSIDVPSTGALTFSVSDDDEVASVSVKLNGEVVATESPAVLTFTDTGKYNIQITAVDSAGQISTFGFSINIVEEPVGAAFELKLEAGMNYFGIPVYVDKTLGEILPGVNVYRRSGTSWVLANDEKPMAFAVYRASLTEAKTVALEGEAFGSSSVTLKRNVSNYLSIPQISPVNANDLFGDALVSLSVITTNGAMVKVTDGIMLPGNAYVIIVSKDITINLPESIQDK